MYLQERMNKIIRTGVMAIAGAIGLVLIALIWAYVALFLLRLVGADI